MSIPAPAGGLVAVISKQGRFLVAEPLFPRAQAEGRPSRQGRSERITINPGRDGAGRSAAVGDLVLLAPAAGTQRRSGSSKGPQIVRVLGRPDVARDVLEALMLDRGLKRGFDPVIEREARQASKQETSKLGRVDLRGLATFTIDPIGARDFDDAISAARLDDGTLRVWVHIADVSAYVPAGSPLDKEARRRATSVYVPGAVEPMLPQTLSGGACSLMAGQDRLAVSVEMDLDGASVKRVAFHRSIIRSDVRLTYERVDRIFAGLESADDPWGQPLAIARQAAGALEDERRRRGGLTLDTLEPQFEFDRDGNVSAIQALAQTESHRLIEHLMITANEAVARLLEEHRKPCLYRVHERPDPERISRLVDQLQTLDVPTPPLPEHMSSTEAAELLGEISQRVERHVARVSARARAGDPKVSSTGGRLALTSLVLRSLKQAYYSPRNIGHAGLGSPCYCHFTSPIRRYPDLVCHRALLEVIGAQGGEGHAGAGNLGELAAWTSERERDAMVIERDADDVARCFALERLLGQSGRQQTFSGEITGLISAGAFVAFGGEDRSADGSPSMPIYEGMLPVRRIGAPHQTRSRQEHGGRHRRSARGQDQEHQGREWWDLGEHGTILYASRSGRTLRLGDRIEVQVVRVECARGRVDLSMGAS